MVRFWMCFGEELILFVNELDVECERNRRFNNDFKVLGLSRWKDRVVVN